MGLRRARCDVRGWDSADAARRGVEDEAAEAHLVGDLDGKDGVGMPGKEPIQPCLEHVPRGVAVDVHGRVPRQFFGAAERLEDPVSMTIWRDADRDYMVWHEHP